MAEEATFRIYRGDNEKGEMVDYKVPVAPGMVVLDAVHAVQAMSFRPISRCAGIARREVRVVQRGGERQAAADVHGPDGQVSGGRADHDSADEDVPGDEGSGLRRVVELRGEQEDSAVQDARSERTSRKFSQEEADRVQEFRKCIECFLCQDVCHVLRDHEKQPVFAGPRFFVRVAGPRDASARYGRPAGAGEGRDGLGYCNITKCCTEVCPGAHQDHGQRDHSAQGAGGGSVL